MYRSTVRYFLVSVLLAASAEAAMAQTTLSLADLKAGLAQLSMSLPQMLDDDTRLDRVEGGAGEVLYFNTLVNYTFDQFPDPQLLLDAVAPGIFDTYCNGADMAAFRAADIALLYLYYDKNGELIGTVKANNSTCQS